MSTRDIDVIKQTILQNKIVSSDTISQFMEKCNNNFSAIIEFGGGPVGEKGEKGEDGVPTKPKVPIHVWKEGEDYDFEEEMSENKYKISGINDVVLSDPKYQDGHLIILENAHVYVLELDNFQLKPKFLTIFNTYNPYNNLEKNKAYVHIAYADEYYDGGTDNPHGFITSNELNEKNEDPLNKIYIGVYSDDKDKPSDKAYAYNWSKIKGEQGEKGEKGEKGDTITQIEKTYSELITLKTEGNLIPGMQYRITDFVTTCNQSGSIDGVITYSAEHQFDIIVTADTTNTLNADARVCLHVFEDPTNEDSEYFLNNKLSDWKIKYDINNDATKYKWAVDPEIGKGVIYWMQDEFGNEACYDFKNILFNGKYTFDLCTDTNTHSDFSLLGDYCFENKIKGYYDSRLLIQCLNNNLCLSTHSRRTISLNIFGTNTHSCIINTLSRNNHIGDNCYNITLGSGCYGNTLGKSCNNITLGNNCYNNTLGSGCYENTLGGSCYSNTFGYDCNSNELGENCCSNTFGDRCVANRFSDYCSNNELGNGCTSIIMEFGCLNNIFENNCYSIIFKSMAAPELYGSYYRFNKFGQGCNNIVLESVDMIPPGAVIPDNLKPTLWVQNYNFINDIYDGNPVLITTERGLMYETKFARDTEGIVRMYTDFDIIDMTNVTYDELFKLKNSNMLTPGMQYRITDFVTTCNSQGAYNPKVITFSANHQFDIIVTADTADTLNANARVCLHVFEDNTPNEFSEYFLNNKLSEWKIKYDINNDITKYKWAAEDGKGVIYWMQDEFGNEACYDFKNILFDKCYTFDLCVDGITHADFSLLGTYCYENKIKGYYDSTLQYLNNNLCLSTMLTPISKNIFDTNTYSCIIRTHSKLNHIGNSCYDITLGNDCSYNTFGNNCFDIAFVIGCNRNTFENNCYTIKLGNDCNNNTFGNDCYSYILGDSCFDNTFGNSCNTIRLGNNCYSNEFGNGCNNNTLGSNCNFNIFGNICNNIILGDGYISNTFENDCSYIIFGVNNELISGCKYNHFGVGCMYINITCKDTQVGGYVQNYTISKFSQGTNRQHLMIDTTRNLPHIITFAKTSSGLPVYYCEADLYQQINDIINNKEEN